MALITPSESKGDRPLDLSLAIGGNTPSIDKPLNTDLSIKYEDKPNNFRGYNFQDLSRYSRFIDEIYPNVNLERQAASNQSGWGKFGNMLAQGVGSEVLAQGVIGGAGSLVGLPKAIWDELNGRDADFNNFLTRYADNITEEIEGKQPIFRYNPGKTFDWRDWGWWTSNGVSILSTLGLLIPAAGEMKLASYMSKGLKAVSEATKANKLMKGISATTRVAGDIFDTEQYWQRLTHSAFAMRNAENFRESSQNFNLIRDEAFAEFQDDSKYEEILNSEVGQEFLAEGRSPSKIELANFIASKASWRQYAINSTNVVFDALQLAPLFRGFKVKTRNARITDSPKVLNMQNKVLGVEAKLPAFNTASFIKGGSLLIGEQMTEGVEELINAIGQSEGSWYGKYLVGKEKDTPSGTRLSEYLQDPSSWEQAFWGFLGGVTFSGATRGIKSFEEALKDRKDPHSDTARMEEIEGRAVVMSAFGDQIQKITNGTDPRTGAEFVGTESEIKSQQELLLENAYNQLGTALGLNASRHGNVNLLLDMLGHNNFKEVFLNSKIGNEENFDKVVAKLTDNVKTVEKAYKSIYDKIFTPTASKPWIREAIIEQAIYSDAKIRHLKSKRNDLSAKIGELRANNPALESLREKNKDKDFEGTLNNLINSAAVQFVNEIIANETDENVKTVLNIKKEELIKEILQTNKDLKDTAATGDFNSISDIIYNEADKKLLDMIVGAESTAYEEIVNTDKSIPKIEKKIKDDVNTLKELNLRTFRDRIAADTNITDTETLETLDAKIKQLDDLLSNIESTKKDPFQKDDSPIRNLSESQLRQYKSIIDNRRAILNREKTRKTSMEAINKDREERNKQLIDTVQSNLNKLGLKNVPVKYTGKHNTATTNFIKQHLSELATILADNATDITTVINAASVKQLDAIINQFSSMKILEEFINDLLVIAGGYVSDEAADIDFGKFSMSNIHTQTADEFKNSLSNRERKIIDIRTALQNVVGPNGAFNATLLDGSVVGSARFMFTARDEFIASDGSIIDIEVVRKITQLDGVVLYDDANIKSVVDFTSQNPTSKNFVDFANKWITGIINDGTPLYTETNPDGSKKKTGTRINFIDIAEKYGTIVGVDRLKQDYEYLKRAYYIVSDSKINPETGAKRIYNTRKTIESITAQYIIDTRHIDNDVKNYDFFNTSSLEKSGGLNSLNIFLPDIDKGYSVDDNGNYKLDDNADSRLQLLLTSLQKGNKVRLKVNTKLSGKQGFSQNKDNSDTIPIGVYADDNGKEIFIGSITTLPTSHYGLTYNFKGTDWTDILLKDSIRSNNKMDILNRIFPLLYSWYNNQKMNIKEVDEDNTLNALLESDAIGLIPQLISGKDLQSKEGKDALMHICRVLFYGENHDGTVPVQFNRAKIIEKVSEWKDKLYRDHLNTVKIRRALGTDVDATIESSITHITSGNIINTYDSNGQPVYNNVATLGDISTLKLYKVTSNTSGLSIENINDPGDYRNNPRGEKYKFQLYIGVEGNGTTEDGDNIVRVPAFSNNLNGNLYSDKNSEHSETIDKVFTTLVEIGAIRKQIVELRNLNKDASVSSEHSEINRLQKILENVVRVSFEDKGYQNTIISNSSSIKFKAPNSPHPNHYIIYNYYDNKFYSEKYEPNKVTRQDLTEQQFKDQLGLLRRNINYNSLNNKPFTSITGKEYNTYQEYLISTGAIVTNVGSLKDKNGNVISHFLPRRTNSVAGVNLMVNIDTSAVAPVVSEKQSFLKFVQSKKLDSRYEFAYHIIDSMVKNSEISFDGSMSVDQIDPVTGNKALVFYSPSTKSLVVTREWGKIASTNPIGASLTLVHDILHSIIDSRTPENKSKLIRELTKFRDTIINTPEFKQLSEKKDKTELEAKLFTIFTHPDVEEILTYGLTDIDAAKFLNSIKTTQYGVTVTLWAKLKEIIRQIGQMIGVNTKLDELTYIFDQFIAGKEISSTEVRDELGDISGPDFDEFTSDEDVIDIKPVAYSSYKVLNKIDVINEMISMEHPIAQEILRDELPKLNKQEFEKYAKKAGYYSLGKYWTLHPTISTYEDKYSSYVNYDINEFPFSGAELDHVLNIMSNAFIRIVTTKYKDVKVRDAGVNVRKDLVAALANVRKTTSPELAKQIWTPEKNEFLYKTLTEIRDNDDLWNLFKIQMRLKYGYDINEEDQIADDVEFLEKSWDQMDVYTKHIYTTISNEIKDLINTTYEVDPNSITLDTVTNELHWKEYSNTPTGFANTLDFSKRGMKIIDLMQDCITKQDMLDALFKYAMVKDSIFAKSLLSIHKKLKENDDLLNTWYTSFSKAIVDSYRDLYKVVNNEGVDETEVSISVGNKKAIQYKIANDWVDTIVSRGETGYFTQEWATKWEDLYSSTAKLSAGFDKMDTRIADGIIELYEMIGIEIGRDFLIYEFKEDQKHFIDNIITPLKYIKKLPNEKPIGNVIPYIDQVISNPKAKFDQFGRLLGFAKKVKYFTEEGFTFSNVNTFGNLTSDAGNHSFITNMFKNLNGSDSEIYNTLEPYTLIPANQNSFLLWGDLIVTGETKLKGRGFINYVLNDKGIKVPLQDKDFVLNKENLRLFKFYRYEGDKDLNTNKPHMFSTLTKNDWTLKTLLYYFGAGQRIKDEEGTISYSAIFPILNPSDRKNTGLIEAPIIPFSSNDLKMIKEARKTNNYDQIRNIPIFKAIYNNAIDELIAANTAKNILFNVDENGAVIGDWENLQLSQDVIDDKVSPQLFYHYKFDENGNRSFVKFSRDEEGVYKLDKKNSGNVFNINNMFVIHNGKELTFADISINGISFVQFLLQSGSLSTAMNTPLIADDPNSTFANRLRQFTFRFITQQLDTAEVELNKYKPIIETTYLKKENTNREDRVYILNDKSYDAAIGEYVLNTYLFNTEQVRFFHGSMADYKHNIDFNKRGGKITAHGLSSSLEGYFNGATISDVKLKSNIYNHIVGTLKRILGHQNSSINIKKLNKIYTAEEVETNTIIIDGKKQKLFNDAEKDIYSYSSPYLNNDSANAVSFVTFDEFVKRIKGYGLYNQYKAIIDKITNRIELNREEYNKFATMQKNFYYSLDYNSDLRKMIPTQVKNAEVILTPNLVANLQLEDLVTAMNKTVNVQINLASAEKHGSLYIGNVADEDGNLLDYNTVITELSKARRQYNYQNLRMQLETPDAVYEEHITLGRQTVKKIIDNIPNDHIYSVGDEQLSGQELKTLYFDLLNENVYQSAADVANLFNIRLDADGNIIGKIEYDKIINHIIDESFSRGFTLNNIYGLKTDPSVNNLSKVPIWHNSTTKKTESILTSLFTNNITNQTFPGIHAPQMSSLFMNKKVSVKQSDLTGDYVKGIQWHEKMFEKLDPSGKVTKRKDIKLRSNILYNEKEGLIIKAEVLLPRWAKEFYGEGKLININELSEEVRTMLGYRMPTEAKYSMYVFEVVGFLPDSNGPAIVLPDDFATKTGSDFDMDTVYALTYNLHRNRTIEINPENKARIESYEIERVPYIKGNTQSDIDRKVNAIMRNRSQLIHVLSKELTNKEIIAVFDELNTIYEENKEFKAYIEEHPVAYEVFKKSQREIDSINKQLLTVTDENEKQKLITKKYSLYQNHDISLYLSKSSNPTYKKIVDKVSSIISNKSDIEQNTKEARENKILDIMIGILSDPYHYIETIALSSFKDISDVKGKIDDALGLGKTRVNNLTFDGQNHYRDKSQQGRNLKGISIALARFNSIAQIANVELTNRLKEDDGKISDESTLPSIRYEITKNDVDRIKNDFGTDASFETMGSGKDAKYYVTIRHRFIGNNPGNTFKNVENKYINSYAVQISANILDNVNFPLPSNINDYTIDLWHMLVSIGSTYNVSTMFLHQPVIRDITDFYFNNINTISRDREIEETKRKYQTLLYKCIKASGKSNDTFDNQISRGGKYINIQGGKNTRERLYKFLGYKNNTAVTISENELYDNLNFVKLVNGEFPELNEELGKESPNLTRVKQIEDFLRYQLEILETYKNYKKYAVAVKDGAALFNTDKIGAGPTLNTTNSLIYKMNRSHEKGILEIDGVSAVSRIFPKFFGRTEKSKYSYLEQHFVMSNLFSFNALKDFFIGQSDLYRYLVNVINNEATDIYFDSKLADHVTAYFNNALISDLPWLNNFSTEEKQALLGINNPLVLDLDLTNPDALIAFEGLSVANQVKLLQTRIGKSYEANNVISLLSLKLQEKNIKSNGYHVIEYNNNDNPDEVSNSFNNLWYSDDIYERIVARNLLKYDYLVNGFGFKFNSFSKIIPNNLFFNGLTPFREGRDNESGINLSQHLYGKHEKIKQIQISDPSDLKIDVTTAQAINSVFGEDYIESFLRANYQNDSLVPDAGRLTHYDSQAMNQEGELGVNRRYLNPDFETGIISISAKKLQSIPTSRLSDKVKNKKLVKLSYNTENGTEYFLFKRDDSFVTSDDFGISGYFYYYPVCKLESFEHTEQSIFPKNNVFKDGSEILSPNDYRSIIANLQQRNELKDQIYLNSLNLKDVLPQIIDGDKTAVTYSDRTPDLFATAEVGSYIQIEGTDHYVRVVKNFTKIDLSQTVESRKIWAEKEGVDIEATHKVENGVEFQDRTDLYQMEFVYAGTFDDILNDEHIDTIEAGDIDDISNEELPEPIIVAPSKTSNLPKLSFVEDESARYQDRTAKNALADVTIAFAVDFDTPGEKSTFKAVDDANKHYISAPIGFDPAKHNYSELTDDMIENFAKNLAEQFPKDFRSVNIAGNGIYSLEGRYTQDQIDEFVYKVLKTIHSIKPIQHIRSGGQTGVDEAGIKAAMRLNIPSQIIAPNGWKFRVTKEIFDAKYKGKPGIASYKTNRDSTVDISSEKFFKERFGINIDPQTSIRFSSYVNTIKPGVDFVFEQNPELAEIGSKELYSAYLSTIFPNSKVKDIVYHGGAPNIQNEGFDLKYFGRNDPGDYGKGIYFTPNVDYANGYAWEIDGKIISALINSKNLKTVKTEDNLNRKDFEDFDIKNIVDDYVFQYVIRNPQDIHILGSQKDINGFQNYVNTLKFSSYYYSSNESINEAITAADKFVKKIYGNFSNRAHFSKSGVFIDAVKELKELDVAQEISDMDLANFADALKTILKQYDFDLNAPRQDKFLGGILSRLNLYENTSITELVNEPVLRKEFTGFMYFTSQFLQGTVNFELLQSADGENFTEAEKVVNDLIKQLQALTPAINNSRAKFDRLYEKFVEADLRQYTSNPDIVAGIKKILDPGDDENNAQRWMDAMADTNNSYIALLVKKYSTAITSADLDSTDRIGKFESILRKAFGKEVSSLKESDFFKYLEFKKGKPTGRLIQKYDMDKFYADKREYFTYYATKYGRDSLEFKRASAAWYNKKDADGNVVPNNEIRIVNDADLLDIIQKKKIELSSSEFDKWKRRNVYEYEGKIHVKVSDTGLAVPTDKYINPDWNAVKDDPVYQELTNIIATFTDHFGRATILNKGYIPIQTKEKTNTTIKEKFDGFIASNKYHRKSEQFVGENNDMVYLLTIPMIQALSSKETINIPEQRFNESKEDYSNRVLDVAEKATGKRFRNVSEVYEENRKIRSEIEEETADKLNYNLYNVFSQFIREANRYKAKAGMKYEYDMAVHKLRRMKFIKRDSTNKLLKNNAASKALEMTVAGEKTGGSNLEAHFVDWLEAIFYENFDIDEGTWTTIGKMLLKYTSAKSMWLNLTAGISNVGIGKLQVRMEGFSGWYFDNKDLASADKKYFSAVSDMIANIGSTKANTLTNAIIKLIDIAQNTNEKDYTTGMLKKQLWSWSSLYFINDLGEHYMQNVSALAMIEHNRIIDGDIVSYKEYQYNNYKKALESILNEEDNHRLQQYLALRYDKEEFKESKKDYLRDFLFTLSKDKQAKFIEEKKKLDANSEKEFKAYPKLIEAFELDKNGYAKFKDEVEIDGVKHNIKLNKNQFELFRNKALKVVQKQQGIYNKEDAGMMQRWMLGKLAIQFRKFMRPGWNKRFGSKFGKSFWTESRDEWDKGSYVSLLQFLGTPFKKKVWINTDEAEIAHKAMGNILSDIYKFITNIGIYWNTLDDFEKGNVRRATTEIVYLAAVFAIGGILKRLKPEDDDDENFAYDLTVYELDRLLSEIGTFTPIGIINEGRKVLKSPAAVQTTLIDSYKLLSNLVGYPFQSEEKRYYSSGVYSKESKLKISAMKMVPIANKWLQLKRINKFNKYYILFRG